MVWRRRPCGCRSRVLHSAAATATSFLTAGSPWTAFLLNPSPILGTMLTRAAARRSAGAAQAAGAAVQAAPQRWAHLLWEAVAEQLPIQDVLSLRQAWRGASQLAKRRVYVATFS